MRIQQDGRHGSRPVMRPHGARALAVAGQEVGVTFGGGLFEVTVPASLDLAGAPWGVGALRGGFACFRSIRAE